MKICLDKRGVYIETKYLTTNKVQMIFEIPLAEVIFDFFERLKAISRGYASFDYEIIGEKKSKFFNVKDFIEVKGYKAIGKIIDSKLRMSSFRFESSENINHKNNISESKELTLF